MESNMRKWGIPEGEVRERVKFSEFLAKRRLYRKARDNGTLTEEQEREYRQLIENLDK